MKSLIPLIVAIVAFVPAAFAGEDCAKACEKAKTAATVCEKSKASVCEKAKAECPVAKAALRKALTTHKGTQLASR